eukprot:COSAG01_NODE_425_length_17240_cov_29.899306_23_plen_49_part_00
MANDGAQDSNGRWAAVVLHACLGADAQRSGVPGGHAANFSSHCQTASG